MDLGAIELFISIFLGLIGVLLYLRRFYYDEPRIKNSKVHFTFLLAFIIVLLSGVFTPPDIFSNALFSVPLYLILLTVMKRTGLLATKSS